MNSLASLHDEKCAEKSLSQFTEHFFLSRPKNDTELYTIRRLHGKYDNEFNGKRETLLQLTRKFSAIEA